MLWMEAIQLQAGFDWTWALKRSFSSQDAVSAHHTLSLSSREAVIAGLLPSASTQLPFLLNSEERSEHCILVKGAAGAGKRTLVNSCLHEANDAQLLSGRSYSFSFVLGRNADTGSLVATSVDLYMEELESVVLNSRERVRATKPLPKRVRQQVSFGMFLFDVSDRASFRLMMRELKRFGTDPLTQHIPVMVLANKVDVNFSHRKVSFEEARQVIPVEIELVELSTLYAGNTEIILSKILRQLCSNTNLL